MWNETFYAAAAGAFPLLVVVIVVMIQSFRGRFLALHSQALQVGADLDVSKVELEERQAAAEETLIDDDTAHDDRLEALTILKKVNESMLERDQAEKMYHEVVGELSYPQRLIARLAWLHAALFGIGEFGSFMAIGAGPNNSLTRYVYGPLTTVALMVLIVSATIAVGVQSLDTQARS